MTDTQTVEQEPKEQVTPASAEVTDAQAEKSESTTDWDALLSEWGSVEEPSGTETETVQKPTTAADEKPALDDALKDVVDYVRNEKAAKEKEDRLKLEKEAAEEYKKVVSSVKGELPISETLVDGWLQSRAREDARIASAYQNRAKKPDAWARVEKALRHELHGELSKLPDKNVTDTRKQIAGAIQNAQTNQGVENQKPMSDMTDNEFMSYLNGFVGS